MSDEHDEFVAGFWSDLAEWLKHATVSPENAALLLAGHDPDEVSDPHAELANLHVSTDQLRKLRHLFQAYRGEPKNLIAWHDYAISAGYKPHPWIKLFLDPWRKWEVMTPEERTAAWRSMSAEGRRLMAQEAYQRCGSQQAAAEMIGVSRARLRELLAPPAQNPAQDPPKNTFARAAFALSPKKIKRSS